MYTSTLRLAVAAAHDLHLLEDQRAPLAEHVVALRQLALERDRPDLPARQRRVRQFLGEAGPADPAALFRHREIAGDALDLGIVDGVGRELVVGREEFPHRALAQDEVGPVGGGRHRQRRAGDDKDGDGAGQLRDHRRYPMSAGEVAMPDDKVCRAGPDSRLRQQHRVCCDVATTYRIAPFAASIWIRARRRSSEGREVAGSRSGLPRLVVETASSHPAAGFLAYPQHSSGLRPDDGFHVAGAASLGSQAASPAVPADLRPPRHLGTPPVDGPSSCRSRRSMPRPAESVDKFVCGVKA